MPFLGVAVGRRGVGLGEACTAVADDVFALQWNPAGLALVKAPEAAFMHNEWLCPLGLRQEFLNYGQPWAAGGLAASLTYFSMGNLEQRDGSGALTGQGAGSDFAGSLGYGLN